MWWSHTLHIRTVLASRITKVGLVPIWPTIYTCWRICVTYFYNKPNERKHKVTMQYTYAHSSHRTGCLLGYHGCVVCGKSSDLRTHLTSIFGLYVLPTEINALNVSRIDVIILVHAKPIEPRIRSMPQSSVRLSVRLFYCIVFIHVCVFQKHSICGKTEICYSILCILNIFVLSIFCKYCIIVWCHWPWVTLCNHVFLW